MLGFVLAGVDSSVYSRVLSIAAYTKSAVFSSCGRSEIIGFVMFTCVHVRVRSPRHEMDSCSVAQVNLHPGPPQLGHRAHFCNRFDVNVTLKTKRGRSICSWAPRKSTQNNIVFWIPSKKNVIWGLFLRFSDLSGSFKNVFAVIWL